MKKPLALIIMDGFGLRKETEGNAIAAAKHPNLDRLWATCPHTQIGASGLDVGLPDGQMGNSEVGHTNMGAGRIVYQELTRITKSIEEGEYLTNPALAHAMENAKKPGAATAFRRRGAQPQPAPLWPDRDGQEERCGKGIYPLLYGWA